MTPHPLNTDFAWAPTTGPFRILSDAQARQYDEEGYFLLQGAFTSEEVAGVTAAIDPIEAGVARRMKEKHGGNQFIYRADEITFTTHLVLRSPALKAFSRHPVLRDICHDIIGEGARLYWDQAVYKKPGNPEEFPWHQDNGYAYVEPQQYLTCWIALTDATLENGCPWVIPKVHRGGTLAHVPTPNGLQCLEQPEGAVPVPARAGDIVVFSSLTPHRTGPNLTADMRRAYILQYAPSGIVKRDATGAVVPDEPERQYLVDA